MSATINACGRALHSTPWIARSEQMDMRLQLMDGDESHANMTEQEERKAIAQTVSIIKQTTGKFL